MKDFERVVFFPDSDELDGLAGDVVDGEGGAAARIAVELGQNHAGRPQPLVKFLGAPHRVLAGHGVRHQEHLARPQACPQLADFLHQLFVDVQAPGGVHNQNVVAAVGGVLAGRQGQLNRRVEPLAREARDLDRLGDNRQLLSRRRTVDVRRDQHGPPLLFGQPQRQLAGRRRLTGTLEAHQQENGRVFL